ncbi:hypothetical protein LTR36_006066 [Oleoguttula mirabilis]|uniref:RING-type E3 ubiquitin transferase n=1 Tax=Oleoguttula mirabilis TaxID=1507867 RepID=A0AAV9JDF9_9PEZI|nr:hypothetical protein LTR36_006066 [Oleoguttula mirabilis]
MTEPRAPSTSSGNRRASASRRPDDENDSDNDTDVSWLDFLRAAGATTAAGDRATSADRKRRHTGSEPERRNYSYPYPAAQTSGPAPAPRRPSAMSASSQVGVTRDTAIDLTTPPRPRPAAPSGPGGGDGGARGNVNGGGDGSRRRESDTALSRWQSDAEVSRCPVCKTEFSFWYRKHHCRKCGRVVCSACSPHRITIPRQYIVQPPSLLESEFGVTLEPESPVSRALGGGEVVRVCNPCVPDPWTPDTLPARGEGAVPPRPLIDGARNAAELLLPPSAERSQRYRYNLPVPPASARNRSQSHQPATTAPLSRNTPQSHPNAALYTRDHRQPPPVPASSSSRPVSHRYTQSSSNHPLPPVPTFRDRAHSIAAATAPPSAPPQPPKPKRQVREEDECPVCGTELPPGEQGRETHVEQCIADRFSSSAPSARRPPPAPITDGLPTTSTTTSTTSTGGGPNAADVPTASASASTPPPPSHAHPPPPNRPRTTSYRPRGMALYRATEKDCTTEDGEPQECVICFDEFQPGDEMGRMECLCKFHRACIRRWWETKGAGSCPTHQLHE